MISEQNHEKILIHFKQKRLGSCKFHQNDVKTSTQRRVFSQPYTMQRTIVTFTRCHTHKGNIIIYKQNIEVTPKYGVSNGVLRIISTSNAIFSSQCNQINKNADVMNADVMGNKNQSQMTVWQK